MCGCGGWKDDVERQRLQSRTALETLLDGVAQGDRPCVLVSGCLLGNACRYDGRSKPNDAVLRLVEILRGAGCHIQRVCPEAAGRLPRPRPPAEQTPDGRVVDRAGVDVSAQFAAGSKATLALARSRRARLAVLKAKSPSCGRYEVYDGSFSGTLVPGIGTCARLLCAESILVVDEADVQQMALDGVLDRVERGIDDQLISKLNDFTEP